MARHENAMNTMRAQQTALLKEECSFLAFRKAGVKYRLRWSDVA